MFLGVAADQKESDNPVDAHQVVPYRDSGSAVASRSLGSIHRVQDGSESTIMSVASSSGNVNVGSVSIGRNDDTAVLPVPRGTALAFGFERGNRGSFGINIAGDGSATLSVQDGGAAYSGR